MLSWRRSDITVGAIMKTRSTPERPEKPRDRCWPGLTIRVGAVRSVRRPAPPAVAMLIRLLKFACIEIADLQCAAICWARAKRALTAARHLRLQSSGSGGLVCQDSMSDVTRGVGTVSGIADDDLSTLCSCFLVTETIEP